LKFLFRGYGGAIQAAFQGFLLFADFFGEAVAEFFEEFGGGDGFLCPVGGIYAEEFFDRVAGDV
jgi:hypothetical protein